MKSIDVPSEYFPRRTPKRRLMAIFALAASLPCAAAQRAGPVTDELRYAAAPSPDAPGSAGISGARSAAKEDPVAEKFRRLQKEMEEPASTSGPAATVGGNGKEASSKRAVGNDSRGSETPGVGALTVQVLLGLVFVILLAIISIRLLKRLQGRMGSKPGKAGGDLLEVLETCHLGTNQRVVALRLHDQVGILGVTPQGISLLTVLGEPAAEIRQARLAESNSALFSENLNKLLDRFKKPKRVADLLDEAKG